MLVYPEVFSQYPSADVIFSYRLAVPMEDNSYSYAYEPWYDDDGGYESWYDDDDDDDGYSKSCIDIGWSFCCVRRDLTRMTRSFGVARVLYRSLQKENPHPFRTLRTAATVTQDIRHTEPITSSNPSCGCWHP